MMGESVERRSGQALPAERLDQFVEGGIGGDEGRGALASHGSWFLFRCVRRLLLRRRPVAKDTNHSTQSVADWNGPDAELRAVSQEVHPGCHGGSGTDRDHGGARPCIVDEEPPPFTVSPLDKTPETPAIDGVKWSKNGQAEIAPLSPQQAPNKPPTFRGPARAVAQGASGTLERSIRADPRRFMSIEAFPSLAPLLPCRLAGNTGRLPRKHTANTQAGTRTHLSACGAGRHGPNPSWPASCSTSPAHRARSSRCSMRMRTSGGTSAVETVQLVSVTARAVGAPAGVPVP